MSFENNLSSLKIDWFDGTVIDKNKSNDTNNFGEEDYEAQKAESSCEPKYTERKLMGFKRLQSLSLLEASELPIQLTDKSSFWDLLNTELKPDYIVLTTKIIAKLYMYLQSNPKSFVLNNIMRRKLMPSIFFDTLHHYLLHLPETRITEKRFNTQFWDDIDSFFNSVLVICKGLCLMTEVELVKQILDAARNCVYGLMEEHKECFANELFEHLNEIEGTALSIIKKDETKAKDVNITKITTESNIRDICIFPLKCDLIGPGTVPLQANIVNGAYTNMAHYKEVQFKLLREDYIGPLREGISKYLENPSKRRHENVRVHPKVRVINTYMSNNRVGHLVDICAQRSGECSKDKTKLACTKQLMYGSLLLFTSDNFETILSATVLDSSMKLLYDGYLAVLFHTPVPKAVFSESYLMIESEVYFEPYHQVLKVFQERHTDEIPMGRYIVYVQKETKKPAYIDAETNYTIKNGDVELTFPVLDFDKWPTSDNFGFDQSQMEAYKLALTREFAVIQGPPGTGKTFIGVKIATTLLQNLSLYGTPLLIICYTNHALDQFLEAILKVTDNIVRIGSQSKSSVLEPYNLSNLRAQSKSKYSHLFASKRNQQNELLKQITDVQTDIEKCDSQILTYKTVQTHLRIDDKAFELEKFNEDPILSWLFDDNVKPRSDEATACPFDDWESHLDDNDVDIDTCFSERDAYREIDLLKNNNDFVKNMADESLDKTMSGRFESAISTMEKRLSMFKKYMKCRNATSATVRTVSNLYDLSMDERWIVYFKAANCVKERLKSKMAGLQETYEACLSELLETSSLIDADVMSGARVVGVTTTSAAARHQLITALTPSIVIVEEAAEVLEAHIVASLTHHCQHLILIGDHKQLRPLAAHYKLAKDYNLEVSLFERMIRNGVHARTLTTQRRMRPEFVELIVPTIYDKLYCHPTVNEYRDVKGMGRNLYFLTHNVPEDSVNEDSWSHRNAFEATWCTALAHYLVQKGYEDKELTILATYNGQASLIKQMSKSYSKLSNLRITVVDNFQGEESRIVILSLVRSNRDGKIGFLNAQNRICVALSRAKEGFYMFGNMNLLKSASTTWRDVSSKLERDGAIGQALPICCDTHKDNVVMIDKAELLHDCLQVDGCLKKCKKT